jgi:Icc-related predicted phosphoesterase
MKVVCIADLQAQCWTVDPKLIPEGDMLIVAGDLGGFGTTDEIEEFNDWLGVLPHKYKIVVAGNHDECLIIEDGHKLITNGTYLEDELVEIEGLRIYGTPASTMNELLVYGRFCAFAQPSYLEQSAAKIPDNLDILIAHGPAYGILDKLKDGRSVGSKPMRQAILDKKPKYFICGHIHESHGIEEVFNTTHVNAAICSEYNQMLNTKGDLYFQPIVLDL